ncbi:MAG: DEAD/DEAH box helicase family protein [Bacilli bacterium]
MNTREIKLEEKIEEYLTTKGGYIKSNEIGYDSLKGYKPDILITFIKNTQEKNWNKLVAIHGDITKDYFLKMIEKQIKEFGLLETIRGKIKLNGLEFKLIYFQPETSINTDTVELYNLNYCECVRQLHYSINNNNSLDVVLFINGFPLVTMELKNQYTGQDVNNAVSQYREDRDCNEPIFLFNERSLIHFAVDLFECKMTTRLNNEKTFFLPFNQGSNGAGNVGGAGNPNNENGFGTAYLWKNILTKDMLFEIVQKYMHLEYDKKKSWKTGKMIFPRYHQLDVVSKVVADVKKNGSGKNYLIQHSAGSGKSNSIAWLSYRLSSLHDKNNNKIFDSVIVITDRKVLDNQLQDTIYQFDHVDGTVEKIDKNKSSRDLLKAINDGKKLIITTLQKFPVIYSEINSIGKTFALIVDEAHSSQTGRSASKLKEGLGNTEEILEKYAREELCEEANRPDEDEVLLNELASHGLHANMSFFAFTATPKEKTLQIFGVKQNDGTYKPYHTYSMQQAIEEGFILDVLKNYMTYNMYYKIVKTAESDEKLKSSKGMKAIARFESLHPHNLSQKAAIMIEHFLNTTQYKINGKAKAMVVTSSRLHAVRYLKEFRKYIKDNNLENVDVLVAFSGEIRDGNDTYTEPKLNIDYKGNNKEIKENQLPERFNEDYNVLIVADKYQTGFDEPLLHTMFVDKPLSGVKAVQTLSRLNRTCLGKTDTFILDFVNTAEDIQTAFQPYYQGTTLQSGADPNMVYSIYKRVEAYRIFNEEEVHEFAKTYYSKDDNMELLNHYLHPARTKYVDMDKEEQKEFKSTLQAFIRIYSFIVQVVRMMDKDIQEKYVFCKYLNQVLPKEHSTNTSLDRKIGLEYYRLEKNYEGSIFLVKEEGELYSATGSIGKVDEEDEENLSTIIERINDKYHTKFTNMDKVMEQITQDFIDDEKMVQYAKNNNPEEFKKVYDDEFKKKAFKRYRQNSEMFEKMMAEEGYMEDFMKSMFKYVYESLKNKQ